MPVISSTFKTLAECDGNLAVWANRTTTALRALAEQIEREGQVRGRGTRNRFSITGLSARRYALDASTATDTEIREFLATLALALGEKTVIRAGEEQ